MAFWSYECGEAGRSLGDFGHLCNWHVSLARQPASASDNIRQACHPEIDLQPEYSQTLAVLYTVAI